MATHTTDATMAACPAFHEGCPFEREEDIRMWIDMNKPETIDKCAAFKSGSCPFKGATTPSAIKEVLVSLPDTHTTPGGAPHEALTEMFSKVHLASSKVKKSTGLGDCPVFSTARGGCPFKGTLCSNGVPLIDAMEYRSWGMHALLSTITSDSNSIELNESARPDESPSVNVSTQGDPELTIGEAKILTGNEKEGEEKEGGAGRLSTTVQVSKLLKEGTKAAHKAAENVHFVREFVKGRVSKSVYRRMVANLYFIYQALESGMDAHASTAGPDSVARAGHPLLTPVYFPRELHRTAALEHDLAYYFGPEWRDLTEEVEVDDQGNEVVPGALSGGEEAGGGEVPQQRANARVVVKPLVRPTKVAEAYVARLRALAGVPTAAAVATEPAAVAPGQRGPRSPELLVPHAYTRYLGDLSGGQFLKRAAIKGMGLHTNHHAAASGDPKESSTSGSSGGGSSGGGSAPGVAFYDFPHVPNMKAFKGTYRERLDSLGVDTETADLMVAEANYAFELNTALFVELDLLAGFCDRAVVMPTPPDPEVVKEQAAAAARAAASADPSASPSAPAATPDSESIKGSSMPKASGGGGCPFASLAKAGVPMPAHHPKASNRSSSSADEAKRPSGAAAASGQQAEAQVSKCPIHGFSLVDVAVVLVLIAMMLLVVPKKE